MQIDDGSVCQESSEYVVIFLIIVQVDGVKNSEVEK